MRNEDDRQDPTSPQMPRGSREIAARLLGTGVALVVMALAWRSIGWPAPGVAIALGLGAYLMARPRDR
jgi:hypothetical protein